MVLKSTAHKSMADEDNNNENNKVSVGIRMDGDLFAAVSTLATKEERSVANTIFWLLKQTPQIQELLEAEPATASVN